MKRFFRNNYYWMLSGIAGGVFFLAVFGWQIIDFTNTDWIFSCVKGIDSIQHQAGWEFFRNSQWQWPIGVASAMGYPVGISISFTDSIPLAAIIFKLLSGFLPDTFQYLGFYTFLSFILQGIAAALLLHIFTHDTPTTFVGSLLFIFAPCMINRTLQHTALTSHWLLLFALYLYFPARRDTSFTYHWRFLILNVTALCIHPYIFVMVLAIYLTLIIEIIFSSKIDPQKLKTLVLPFIGQVLSILFVGYAIGLFSGQRINPAKGFGVYSANLNSLFNPMTYQTFSSWSSILNNRSQFVPQLEGFSYLGAGIILGFIILIISLLLQLGKKEETGLFTLKKLAALSNRYTGLIILFFLLWLFAISNVICFDENELLTIPLPGKIMRFFTIFRSSGRFIWIPVFLVILFTAMGLTRVFPKHSAFLLSLLCLIQIFDLTPALAGHHNYKNSPPIEENASEIWETIDRKYDRVFISGFYQDYPLAYWLGSHKKITNLYFSAAIHIMTHSDQIHEDFDEVKELLISDEPLSSDTAYIFQDETLVNEILNRGNNNYLLTEGELFGTHYNIVLPDVIEGVLDAKN